jgi:hypothetical protein
LQLPSTATVTTPTVLHAFRNQTAGVATHPKCSTSMTRVYQPSVNILARGSGVQQPNETKTTTHAYHAHARSAPNCLASG